MKFVVGHHRLAVSSLRRTAAALALMLIGAVSLQGPPAQASASDQLPVAVAAMTASAGLSAELGLAMRIDAASQGAADERRQATEGGSSHGTILRSIGGAVTLGLLVLAGVNSRKRWRTVGFSKEA